VHPEALEREALAIDRDICAGQDVLWSQLRPYSQELHSVPVSAGFERCVRLDLHDQSGRDRGVFDRVRAGQTESTAGQHRWPRVRAGRLSQVDEFLRHVRFGRGCAEATTEAYARALALYLTWAGLVGWIRGRRCIG
jgi:hypothetical protein